MKVGNVSFGAKLTQSTFDFLVRARVKGLNTENMENLMQELRPDEFIYTDKRGDNILSMGFVNKPGQVSLNRKNDIILGSKNYIDILKLADNRREVISDFLASGKIKSYEINQKTIDTITSKLKEIKKSEKLSPAKRAERAIIKKFGFPKPDNGEISIPLTSDAF